MARNTVDYKNLVKGCMEKAQRYSNVGNHKAMEAELEEAFVTLELFRQSLAPKAGN